MKPFNQINVIPFIDIMLVLLAIVLLTATFISKQHIELELPAASNSLPSNETEENLTISINAELQIFFDEKVIAQNMIETELKALKHKRPIILTIDKTVPFDKFIFIIDILKEQQFDNLSIGVREL